MGISTATMRREFPEFIVAGVDSAFNITGTLKCSWATAQRVDFLASASWPNERVGLLVHPATVEAFRALAAVLAKWDYRFREPAGGTVACRKITGGSRTSPHAHGTSIDLNPSANGYRHVIGALDDPETQHQEGLLQWGRFTDMPPAMVRAVERIRTNNGARPWEWGGRWWSIKDPMHFQIDCHRTDLASGIDWATVDGIPLEQAEDEMTLKRGDNGKAVADVQAALIVLGHDLGNWDPFGPGYPRGADGDFGGDTETGVQGFQGDAGLPTTGQVDGLTLGFLFAAAYPPAATHDHPYAPTNHTHPTVAHSHPYAAAAHTHNYVTPANLKAHEDNPDAHHE